MAEHGKRRARRDRREDSTLRILRVQRLGIFSVLCVLCGVGLYVLSPRTLIAQSDLDAFMQKVLARRDENWKKLQQYVIDEAEQIQLTGPSNTPIWGERREYTWFIRDGFFIRSPVRVNGGAVAEAERRKA